MEKCICPMKTHILITWLQQPTREEKIRDSTRSSINTNTTVSQWAENNTWAKQLMSVDKWGADLSWPISSWHQLANEKLTLFGQWAADVRWLAASCLASHFLLSSAFSVKVWRTNERTDGRTDERTEPCYYKFRCR